MKHHTIYSSTLYDENNNIEYTNTSREKSDMSVTDMYVLLYNITSYLAIVNKTLNWHQNRWIQTTKVIVYINSSYAMDGIYYDLLVLFVDRWNSIYWKCIVFVVYQSIIICINQCIASSQSSTIDELFLFWNFYCMLCKHIYWKNHIRQLQSKGSSNYSVAHKHSISLFHSSKNFFGKKQYLDTVHELCIDSRLVRIISVFFDDGVLDTSA